MFVWLTSSEFWLYIKATVLCYFKVALRWGFINWFWATTNIFVVVYFTWSIILIPSKICIILFYCFILSFSVFIFKIIKINLSSISSTTFKWIVLNWLWFNYFFLRDFNIEVTFIIKILICLYKKGIKIT